MASWVNGTNKYIFFRWERFSWKIKDHFDLIKKLYKLVFVSTTLQLFHPISSWNELY